jgi:hypothetical protein
MATAAMAYGERRFEAAYTLRVFAALVVAGLLAGLWAASSDDPAGLSPSTLKWIAIGLMTALTALWILVGKSVLILSDAGVRRESVFGRREMAWGQITETRYRVVPINVYAHFGLIGALVAMSSKSGKSGSAQLTLQLISGDGKKLKVTSNYRHADEAIGLILQRILPPKVQSVKARVQRGETVRFGGLGLSATTVIWKGNSIPVSDVTKAELAGSNLQIKRQGKWMSAVSVRSDKVPDVLVFLEVLESLAPQVKATGIDPLARVRM